MNAFLTLKTNELWQYQLAFLWWLIDSLHKFPLLYYWESLSLSRCSPFAQARNGFQFFGSPPLCQCYPTSHTRHQLISNWISSQNLNWFASQSCSASTCGTWTLNKTDVYKLNFIRSIILPTSMLNSMENGYRYGVILKTSCAIWLALLHWHMMHSTQVRSMLMNGPMSLFLG